MLWRHRSSASTETHQAHTRRQYARMRELRHKRTVQRARGRRGSSNLHQHALHIAWHGSCVLAGEQRLTGSLATGVSRACRLQAYRGM